MSHPAIRPFCINVPDEARVDLRGRHEQKCRLGALSRVCRAGD
jgi:hypothetical protein